MARKAAHSRQAHAASASTQVCILCWKIRSSATAVTSGQLLLIARSNTHPELLPLPPPHSPARGMRARAKEAAQLAQPPAIGSAPNHCERSKPLEALQTIVNARPPPVDTASRRCNRSDTNHYNCPLPGVTENWLHQRSCLA
eukprot:352542-Chlamydomonas_euryale.AAC.4